MSTKRCNVLGCTRSGRVRRLETWLWDDMPAWMLPDWTQRSLLRALCLFVGHNAIDDQCGKPEHRFCYRCGVSQPFDEGEPVSVPDCDRFDR